MDARSPIVYAILAAGLSQRMGFPKALTPLAGASPLQRIVRMLSNTPFVIVTNPSLAQECAGAVPSAQIAINRDPHAGMTSSLRAADAIIEPDRYLGVLLADKPFVQRETLRMCEPVALAGADVVYPVSPRGTPGHPVIFSPPARRLLPQLPDGDTLHVLRDDPSLSRSQVACADAGAFSDLNTLADWHAAELRHGT